MRLVPDDGTGRERLVVIGEAPGSHETAQGRPFVGPAGMRLREWYEAAGLQRTDIYWTNVYPFQPRGNKLETVPRDELAGWIDRLHDRLARLDDPWVLVPTGETALAALTGYRGITRHRGSLYEYHDRKDRVLKVVPTIHSAAVLRQPSWEGRCRRDWARIAGELETRERRVPPREVLTNPTVDDALDFLSDAAARATVLACDIETPREVQLTQTTTKTGKVRQKKTYGDPRPVCIAFSFEPHWAITVPLDRGERDRWWEIVRALCGLPCEKVLQNGSFDYFYLAEHGIRPVNWRWDTLAMHHCLSPADDHDLAYLVSIDTRQPYYKDEAKDPEKLAQFSHQREALWHYCGLDASCTRELFEVYHARLLDAGLLPFYERHYADMLLPLLAIMQHGIRVNADRRAAKAADLDTRCREILTRLTEVTGQSLAGAKGSLSAAKLKRYLYETLKLPAKIDRTTHQPTTNEVAVRQLMLRYPTKLAEAGPLILEHRRAKKLSEFVAEGRVDADGRFRSSYRFTTETGRLSSGKNPRGSGANAQNQDREARDMFVPDEGTLFVSVDLSQAESRVVWVLTGDPQLIELAQAPPWAFDMHRRNGATIFGKPEEAVTKEERYLGKRAIHAGHYGLHGVKLSEILLIDGYVRTPNECQAMIEAYMDRYPAVREWQRRTREQVMRDRLLTNSWGRTLDLTYARLSDEVYRQAYSFTPQSEIADLLNQWGLIPLWRWLRETKKRSRINAQVHDSLLISAVPDEAYEVATVLRASLERPRRYRGVALTIPVEISIGRTWAMTREWKRFPTREEFEAAVQETIR